MAELDGPRLVPHSGQAKNLVVFLHGYGADGNDLIDIGRAWQGLLPDTAFVSPHAPHPCGQAPTGREWFPLTFRDPNERWTGVNQAAPAHASSSGAIYTALPKIWNEMLATNLPISPD